MPTGKDDHNDKPSGIEFGESTGVATGGFLRISRLAGGVGRAGALAAFSRLRGKTQEGWGNLSPKAVENLVRSMGELKGLPMKLGQILSFVDETLPEEARNLLQLLQTQSSRAPFNVIAETVRAELGEHAESLLRGMDPFPVASASIGQVHKARLENGEQVAVKVQYGGIADALASEFNTARAAVRIADAFFPNGNISAFLLEAREGLLNETDYSREAHSQEAFRNIYDGHEVVVVPRVIGEYSSKRVLASRWHDGLSFDAWLATDPDQDSRDKFGVALYQFYLGTLFQHGLFNADPHPGNYLFNDNGQIVMLDYGCIRSFSPDRRRAFIGLREAVLSDDEAELRIALRSLGALDPVKQRTFAAARELLRAFFSPLLEEGAHGIMPETQTAFRRVIEAKQDLMKLGLPADLLFLFRIKYGLHAVLARMGSVANWRELERSWS